MSDPRYPDQPGSDPNQPGGAGYGNDPYRQGGQQGQFGQQGQYGQQNPYQQDPYQQNPYGGGYGQQPPASPKNGLGVAALVLGILSILAFWTFGFGILLGIVAVIMGFVGRGRAKRGEATNGGVALSGIVLGVLGILVGAVFLALTVFVFNAVDGQGLVDCLSQAGGDSAQIEQCQQDFTGNLEEQFSVSIAPEPTP
ncbi:MAG: DUF4190 domain-containing protein [Rhodococcus sp. (in: high G+C Gram-positive bacteria)]